MERIGGIGLVASTSGEHPGSRRQRRRHIDDVFTVGSELLSQPAPQTTRTLHGKPTLRPPLGPLHQLAERAGVHRESTLGNLVAGAIDCDSGVGGFVRIDADQNHRWSSLRSLGWKEVRGGQPDFKSTCLHASVEPHRVSAGRRWHAINEPARRGGKEPCEPVPSGAVGRYATEDPAVSAVNSTSQERGIAPTEICPPTGPTVTSQ